MSDHLLEFLSLVATSSSEMFLIVFTIWWKHNLEKLPFGKVFYLKNLLQLQVFSWSIPVLVLWKKEAHGERELERERDGMRDRPARGSKRIRIHLVDEGLSQFLAGRGPHK